MFITKDLNAPEIEGIVHCQKIQTSSRSNKFDMKITMLLKLKSVFVTSLLLLAFGCDQNKHQKANEENNPEPSITSSSYGKLPNGEEVTQYTLTNKQGMEMKVVTYGGIITSLRVPDRAGKLEDIVLGYYSLD